MNIETPVIAYPALFIIFIVVFIAIFSLMPTEAEKEIRKKNLAYQEKYEYERSLATLHEFKIITPISYGLGGYSERTEYINLNDYPNIPTGLAIDLAINKFKTKSNERVVFVGITKVREWNSWGDIK